MSDEPKDVGALLKQERERKGISLEVVHEATKVPLDALKAIEEGYKVRTLSAFYYKSFVKIYAQYLGLDANFVVTLIPTHHPKPELPATSSRAGVTRASPPSGAGARRVEGVRTRSWNLLAHPIILKKKKKVFKAVLIVSVAVIAIIGAGFVVQKIASALAVNNALNAAARPAGKVATKKPAASKAEANRPDTAKVAQQQPARTAAVLPEGKRISITVRAQITTWINVRSDGAGVFQGNLKKGTASTWNGVKKIELLAKDLGALEFEVNGRNVGKLSRRDLKAKRVIVTPEGLNVEK